MWHLFDGGHTWDSVRGFVFELMYVFQTSKETVLLIKRIREIRIPHFVTYLSVPIPPFKNGLDVSLCVSKKETPKERHKKKGKERERASASERKRESKRKKDRKTECRCIYNHPSCPCQSHYLRHQRHCHNILCRRQKFSVKFQNRSSTLNRDCEYPPPPAQSSHSFFVFGCCEKPENPIGITYPQSHSTLRGKNCERSEQLRRQICSEQFLFSSHYEPNPEKWWWCDEIITLNFKEKRHIFEEIIFFPKPGSVPLNLECDVMWRKCHGDVPHFGFILSPTRNLRGNPRTATIPQYQFNRTKQHIFNQNQA